MKKRILSIAIILTVFSFYIEASFIVRENIKNRCKVLSEQIAITGVLNDVDLNVDLDELNKYAEKHHYSINIVAL